MILLVLPLLSILLLCLSFGKFEFSWAIFIALLPLLVYIKFAKGWFSRHTGLLIWIVGLLFSGFLVAWIWRVDPLIWAQTVPSAIQQIKLLIWIACILAYSSNFLVFGLLGANTLRLFLKKKSFNWLLLAKVLAFWIIAEWARAIIVSIIFWGHGAHIGPNWNFGAFGFPASATPVSYLSRFLGLYGLSAGVLACNLVIFRLIVKRELKPLIIISLLVVIGSSLGLYMYKPNANKVQVGFVQTQNFFDGYQVQLMSNVQNANNQNKLPVSALVYPEGLQLTQDTFPFETKLILNKALTPNGALITSGIPSGDSKKQIDIRVYNKQQVLIAQQAKTLLSPVGEYNPLILSTTFNITHNKQLETVYEQHHTANPGQQPIIPITIDGVSYGIFPCSGIMSSTNYQLLTKKGAQILVNSGNLQFFGFEQYDQIRQIVHFQTIANARPFINAINGGYSYILTSDGKELVSSHGNELAIYSANVTASSRRTVFSIMGEWTVAISILFIFIIYAKHIVSRLYRKNVIEEDKKPLRRIRSL